MAKVTIHQETPSEGIVKAANKTDGVTDARGRQIGIKKMGPLDRLRFFEMIGAENSKNEQYVGYAALAYMVVSIDGEAVIRPADKRGLEALVQRLDDDGMDAIAKHLASFQDETANPANDKAALKNG